MRLQQIIAPIAFLTQSFLCIGMGNNDITLTMQEIFPSDQFINFSEKPYKKININFVKKFGYNIPDTLVIESNSVYKAIPQCFIKEQHVVQDICSFPEGETIQLNKTLRNNKKIQQIINEKRKLHNKAKLLEQKIAQQQVETEKLEQEIALKKAELAKKNTSQPKINNKHIATQKKKNNTSRTTINKPALPQHDLNHNVAQQIRKIKKSLINEYKVQTEKQLKEQLAKQCIVDCCLYVRFDQYCTWRYCSDKNILDIDTNDPESSDDSDEAGSY